MMLRKVLALTVLAGSACTALGQGVIISEIVDGPLSGGNPKFIELTNTGATPVTFATGDAIRYLNNGSSSVNQSVSLAGITINPGQAYSIAGGTNGSPPAEWIASYGPFNLPSLVSSTTTNFVTVNGNDVVQLFVGGTVVDQYGVIGEATGDIFTMPWAYADSYVRRRPNICSPNATFTISEWIIVGNNALEQPTPDNIFQDLNFNNNLWTNNTGSFTSPNTHAFNCAGIIDCNGNGISDTIDIANGTPDCNGNGVPDSCDIALGARDLNNDGIPDTCQPGQIDCNNNGISDLVEIAANPALDCNADGRLDSCQFASRELTDVNANGTPDVCEGAAIVLASVAGTVQPSPSAVPPGPTPGGVRGGANGTNFFNIQGLNITAPANRSYGGLRFSKAAMIAQFNAQFGVGGWEIDRVVLHLVQSNAAFTRAGDAIIWHSSNDTTLLTPGTTTTVYDNFNTDFPAPPREAIRSFSFVQGTNTPPAGTSGTGTGTIDLFTLYDVGGSNSAGALLVGAELNNTAATDELTILISEDFAGPRNVSATYAGVTSFLRGPTLVIFARPASGPTCPPCPADFDNSGDIEPLDVRAFFNAYRGEDPCSDVDGNGEIEPADIARFFAVTRNPALDPDCPQ